MSSAVFVRGNTDISKFFEIDHLVNQQTIKTNWGHEVKYFVYKIQ